MYLQTVLRHFLREFLLQAAEQEAICTIILFYFLTSLTPIVNTIMQIINVIKVD